MKQYIFDTNHYRNIVFNKSFSQLKTEINFQNEIEKLKEVKPIFSIVTAIELINNLNEKDTTAKECLKALKFLTAQCRNQGAVVPTFYDILTMYFYRKTSKFFIFNNNILSLSFKISNVLDFNEISQFESEISQVVEIKKNERENIIKNIENSYLSSIHPEKKIDWEIFEKSPKLKAEFQSLIESQDIHKIIGLSLVKLAMEQVESKTIKLNKTDFEENFLGQDFKVSIDFLVKELIEKMTTIQKKKYFYKPESDPKKRWNSFYDAQLIFATEYENYFGRETILVTNEKKIKETFKRNGKIDLCIDSSRYRDLIK